jgi:hypothetical protein
VGRPNGNDVVGVAGIGYADGAVAVSQTLFRHSFEARVSRSRDNDDARTDELIAGVAYGCLPAAEAVDIVA